MIIYWALVVRERSLSTIKGMMAPNLRYHKWCLRHCANYVSSGHTSGAPSQHGQYRHLAEKRGCGWEQPKSDSPTQPKSVKEPDEGGPSREVPVPHRHQYRFWGKIDLVYMQSLALGGPVPMGAPRPENGTVWLVALQL